MPGEPLTPEAFQARLSVSRETQDKFRAYAELLRKWNRAINLVSPTTLDDLWRRHFLDSAQQRQNQAGETGAGADVEDHPTPNCIPSASKPSRLSPSTWSPAALSRRSTGYWS